MHTTRALFQFSPQDFAAIDDHHQTWRFGADVLPQVRVLNAETGQAVHAVLAGYASRHAYALSEQRFSDIEECDASRDDAIVAAWLRARDTDSSQDVLVGHGHQWVYVVTWGLFCDQWSDFCLPSSDDVLICPVSEAWVLFYWHEEIFFWGRPIRTVD